MVQGQIAHPADDVTAISHDLKNPLSVISCEVSVIQQRLPAYASAELRRSLARIVRNARYIDRLVHDLLDLAAIDNHQLTIALQPVELGSLIAGVLDRMISDGDRPRVHVVARDPVTVMADAMRIERVLANLVQNAMLYAPPHSDIDITLAVSQDWVRVSVVDLGPGIAPADAALVFEEFRRGESAHGHDGTGLGLYVSRRIVEAHGGRIGVDSTPGKGSRFFFVLPLPTNAEGQGMMIAG